jgi:chorismate mutase
MPAPPSPRRRFQFHLRTLLIGVTLLAVLSSAVTWVVRDRQRLIDERNEAVKKLQEAKADAQTMNLEYHAVAHELMQRLGQARSAPATKP